MNQFIYKVFMRRLGLISTAGDNLLLRRAHRVKSYVRQLWRTRLVSRSRQNKKIFLTLKFIVLVFPVN